jgi:hypothetical protein
MVRRMNPSLVCRVDTSHSAIASYSSISFASVTPDSGVCRLTWEPRAVDKVVLAVQSVFYRIPGAVGLPCRPVVVQGGGGGRFPVLVTVRAFRAGRRHAVRGGPR